MAALKKLFKIQYVSDLHLEYYDKLAFPLVCKPAARYLALAGDIGRPDSDLFKSFMDYTSRNWERVFYVSGNHEYYARAPSRRWKYSAPKTMFEIQEIIKHVLEPYKNIHYLCASQPSIYLNSENVAIVGTTLWTHIDPSYFINIAYAINDYKYIPYKADDTLRLLMPGDVNELHAQNKSLLETQIDYWGAKNAEVCVITHHMPSFLLLNPKFVSSPYNCCFASNCETLMKPCVKAWIYGHTHDASSRRLGNTICAINARGYPNEVIHGFSATSVLELSDHTVGLKI